MESVKITKKKVEELKEKVVEKGLIYKTSRVSYMENYFILGLLLIFIYLLLPYLNLKIVLITSNPEEAIRMIIFLLLLLPVGFMIEEPTIEQWIRQYIVTNDEVIKVEGVLRKRRIVIPYQSVAEVILQKSVLGRIFNYGNVIVSGFKQEIKMKGIRNPDEVCKIINYRIRQRQVPRLRKPEKVEEND